MSLIDREALIAEYDRVHVGAPGGARKLMVDAPEVRPEKPKWIPVTERLPEEGQVVLTQAKFKDDMKMAVSSRVDYNYWTTWGTRDINIIAWMPLPEPYREEEQND